MLFRMGYLFGENDLVEDLCYAKYLANNDLYKSDFYINHIANHVPNERYIFANFAAFLGSRVEVFFFLGHAMLSFYLLLGLNRLSDFWIENKGLKWIALVILLLCLDNIHLGGNELYYNMLVPSYVAQVFGLWAILFFLEQKVFWTVFLLFITTLFHPLIGAQLWMILLGMVFINHLKELLILKNIKNKLESFIKKVPITLMGFACFLASMIWILKIQNGYNVGVIDTEKWFEIMQFRASHHYFPLSFPIKNSLILVPIFSWGYLFFRRNHSLIARFYEVVVLGIFAYMIGVYVLKQPLFLSTQWFATTIWLEMFSVMGIMAFLQNKILIFKQKDYEKQIIIGLVAIASMGIFLMIPQFRLFKNKPYQFFCFENQSTSRQIALKAKILTDTNAVFLIPFDNTDFKYWSERSVWIDYKSIAHQKAAIAAWYERVQKGYGVDFKDYHNKLNINDLAKQHWLSKSTDDFLQLKKEGVTHILTFKNHLLNLPIVIENKDWIIYKM